MLIFIFDIELDCPIAFPSNTWKWLRKIKNTSCKANIICKILAMKFGLRYIRKGLTRLSSPLSIQAQSPAILQVLPSSWSQPDSSACPPSSQTLQHTGALGTGCPVQRCFHSVCVSPTGILDISDWVCRALLFCTAHSSTPLHNLSPNLINFTF